MSAPTSLNGPPDRTEWLAPRSIPTAAAPAARSRAARVVDLVARVGTAVTLAALLVLTGTVLTLLDDAPVPAGAVTGGR